MNIEKKRQNGDSYEKTCCWCPFMGTSWFRKYMQYKYTQCLERAGAKVKILTPTEDQRIMDKYLSVCDGFLFPGGPDIDPVYYGQSPKPGIGKSNSVRDQFEIPLMKAAIAGDKPIINIIC